MSYRDAAQLERSSYGLVVADVRAHDPGIRVREAWVWCAGLGHWEFHFHDFFWHGRASGAYDARMRGWSAWLAREGVTGYAVPGVRP